MDIDNLEAIINRADVDEKTAEMYRQVFTEIFKEQGRAFEKLEDKLLAVVSKKEYIPAVQNTLLSEETGFMRIRKDIRQKNGFFHITTDNMTLLTGFVDFTAQEDIKQLCLHEHIGQKNNGESFKFKLEQCDYFTKIDDDLRRINKYYRKESPIAWSPYSRRFVTIELLDGAVINPDDIVDFGIEGLITDKTLMWNLEFENSENIRTQEKVSPYKGALRYVITVERRNVNEFLVPYDDNINAEIKYEDDGSNRTFWMYSEKKNAGFKIVRINNLMSDAELKLFTNKINDIPFLPLRIRTEADAANASMLFGTKDISVRYAGYEFFSSQTKHEKILRTGHYVHADYIRVKPRIVYNLEFDGDSEFIDDYANFALGYLESQYPECAWAGVKK